MATTKKETALVSTNGQLELSGQGVSMYEKLTKFVQESLREGEHYGSVTKYRDGKKENKPCLYKGGAELINKEAQLIPDYEIILEKVDFDQPFFAYAIKTTLYREGMKVSEGFGACSSKEKKYLSEKQDQYFIWNTVLKIAKKRSYVDATVTAWGLSGIFSQDMEDLEAVPEEKTEKPPVYTPPVGPKEKSGKQTPFPGKPDNTHDQYQYFRALYFTYNVIRARNEAERHEWNKMYIGKESTKDFTLAEWEKACELARIQSRKFEFDVTDEDIENPDDKKILPHFEQKNGNNSGITNNQMSAIGKLCEMKGYEIKEDIGNWTVDQAGQAINWLNDN